MHSSVRRDTPTRCWRQRSRGLGRYAGIVCMLPRCALSGRDEVECAHSRYNWWLDGWSTCDLFASLSCYKCSIMRTGLTPQKHECKIADVGRTSTSACCERSFRKEHGLTRITGPRDKLRHTIKLPTSIGCHSSSLNDAP